MPVFISHRTADDQKAHAIANHLHQHHNIKCYVDHLDPEAATTRQITELIVSRINLCTHLMALMTNATAGSWWVPFEVGVARQGDRRISTFDASTLRLPEFLTEWPVIKTDRDLDLFAEAYHRDKSSKPLREKYSQWQRAITSADDFHTKLKAALRTGVML